MGRNGGAPRQFVRKTDVFPTQCLLKSGFVSRISSPPFRPVRVRFRSHPNQCPAPRHVSPLPPHPPPTRRPLFLVPPPTKKRPHKEPFFSSYNTFFNSISTGLFSRIHASAISPWICFMHTFPQCVA